MGLGKRLQDLREAKKESLQQTATAVDTSKGHIWQMERGKAKNPSIGVVTRLADHFGVSVAYLLGEDIAAEDADPELAGMFRQASEFTKHERQILRGMMQTLAAASKQDGQG